MHFFRCLLLGWACVLGDRLAVAWTRDACVAPLRTIGHRYLAGPEPIVKTNWFGNFDDWLNTSTQK
jgi:hypothetical protein